MVPIVEIPDEIFYGLLIVVNAALAYVLIPTKAAAILGFILVIYGQVLAERHRRDLIEDLREYLVHENADNDTR